MNINPNIRTRSSYTFFNSLLKIEDIVSFAKENNYNHAFLIDKNYMHGIMEFYLKCLKENLKPIFGLEIEYQNIHKVLIAKNEKGYKKLLKISSTIGVNEILKLEMLEDENLMEISKNHPIVSYKNKIDKKTLEMFASISNISLVDNISHLQTEINSKELENEIITIIKETNIIIPIRKRVIPTFKIEKKTINPSVFLKKILKEKLEEYIKINKINNIDDYVKRVDYEYKIIIKMKYENYFLIVWDIVKWAKQEGIIVGPGRGSAPGSLISFLLNITTIDPIIYGLLFERFLNPERVTMPDIDIDFEDTRRDEILNYILKKYGIKNVAQIITFQTLRARMSLKDIARIKGVTPTVAEKLSKLIPEGLTLEEAYNKIKNFKVSIDSDDTFKEIYESAKLIEGLPRQHSTHAAGIVISLEPIYHSCPIQKGYSDIPLTQYPMDYMEMNGLLKIDILGLRNLHFIKNIIKLSNSKINLQNTPLNNKEVFNLFAKGKTAGIFQLESPGMTKVLKEMKPTNFEDIVATTSLFRPGPQKQILHYIKRKHNEEKIEYLSKDLINILKPTYGIIIYQEQIMEIAQKFSGLSLAKADILRRAIGKKQLSLIHSLKNEFKDGARNNGHSLSKIEKVYELIVKFSSYGFNRSHAFAYSVLSYQLGYLKVKYPLEFITSLLNSYIGNTNKIFQYILEAETLGLSVELPNINKSSSEAQIINKKSIMLGLKMIKGIGISTVNEILKLREKEKFKNYIDFIVKCSMARVSTATIDLLIFSGALDEFEISRNTMLENKENILKYSELIKIERNNKIIVDYTLAPSPIIVPSKNKDNKIEFEGKSLGFALSESFFKKTKKKIKEKYTPIMDIDFIQNKEYIIIGSILSIREIRTKTNAKMAFLSIEDDTSKINITIWPGIYSKYSNTLVMGDVVLIKGNIDIKRQPTLILHDLKVIKKI